jgi:hypothetical protein
MEQRKAQPNWAAIVVEVERIPVEADLLGEGVQDPSVVLEGVVELIGGGKELNPNPG